MAKGLDTSAWQVLENALDFSNNHTELKFLSFTIGAEEYGIDIGKVQELHRYGSVVRLPDKPPFIKGIVSVNGMNAAVIDVRGKFNVHLSRHDEMTAVVVVSIGRRLIGLIVDRITGVVTLRADQIKPAHIMGRTLPEEYLIGSGAVGDNLLVLVDIEKLISVNDIGLVERLVA